MSTAQVIDPMVWMPTLRLPPTPRWWHVRVFPRIRWNKGRTIARWATVAVAVVFVGGLYRSWPLALAGVVPAFAACYCWVLSFRQAITAASVALHLHRQLLVQHDAESRQYLLELATERLPELMRIVQAGGDPHLPEKWLGTPSFFRDSHWRKSYRNSVYRYATECRRLAYASCELMGIRRGARDVARPCVPRLEASLPGLEHQDPALAEFVRFLIPLAREHDARMIAKWERLREEDAARALNALQTYSASRPVSQSAVRFDMIRWQADHDAEREAERQLKAAVGQLEARMHALTAAEADLRAAGDSWQVREVQQQRERLKWALEDAKRVVRVI